MIAANRNPAEEYDSETVRRDDDRIAESAERTNERDRLGGADGETTDDEFGDDEDDDEEDDDEEEDEEPES